ncbi:unnamed protein product, partial [Pylaiella littoralis]
KDSSKYEKQLAEHEKRGGVRGKKKAQKLKSLNTGRLRSGVDTELEIIDWINELRTDA